MKTPLGQAIVFRESGEAISLGSVWQQQPAILVFLRHFACVGCRAHAAEVWAQRESYTRSGARLIFVGNGLPQNILLFKKEMHLEDAFILTDPHLNAFSAAGFKRSFLGTFGAKAARNFIRLHLKGYRQTTLQMGDGDRLQLGGVVLVLPDGSVRYKFTATATGHFPSHSDLQYISGEISQPFEVNPFTPAGGVPDFSRR